VGVRSLLLPEISLSRATGVKALAGDWPRLRLPGADIGSIGGAGFSIAMISACLQRKSSAKTAYADNAILMVPTELAPLATNMWCPVALVASRGGHIRAGRKRLYRCERLVSGVGGCLGDRHCVDS